MIINGGESHGRGLHDEGGDVNITAGKSYEGGGGSIGISSGKSTETSSGEVVIKTENAGYNGITGDILLRTGDATSGAIGKNIDSGSFKILTGGLLRFLMKILH